MVGRTPWWWGKQVERCTDLGLAFTTGCSILEIASNSPIYVYMLADYIILKQHTDAMCIK